MTGHGFLSGFESWDHLKRFVVSIVASLVVLAFAIISILAFGLTVETPSLKIGIANDQVNATIKSITVEEYGTLITTSDGTQLTNAIVPANKLWLDTGIEVQPGSEVVITASGAVNLATHLSNDLAKDPASFDLKSFNFLIDPAGEALNGRASQPREADEIRRDLAIMPDARLGQLLAVVGSDVGRGQVKPEGIVAFAKPKTTFVYPLEASTNGTLYLSANDLIASADEKDKQVWLLQRVNGQRVSESVARQNIANAYEAGDLSNSEKIDARLSTIEQRWATIVENQYWEAFMEDNSGYFQVAIRITPPTS